MTAAGQRQSAEAVADSTEDGNGASRRRMPTRRTGARIVAGPKGTTDPREQERERLLGRVLVAEGRPSITKAADLYVEAGFEFPAMQQVWLQLLEHRDEERIVEAIENLTTILEDEEPQRRKVLESRLRRIAEFADEPVTQRSASELRRLLTSKYAETL